MAGRDESREQLPRRLEAFGARLRALRRERKLTLQQLGSRVGISHGHLSEMENGHINVTLATVWRLADALGVPATELLDDRHP